jgi:hypothetical protein
MSRHYFNHLIRIILIIFLFSFTFLSGLAQKGGFFTVNHTPRIKNVDNLNYDIAQDVNGLMYFANRKGIIRFDGQDWELLPTPTSVYAIEVTEDNKIYIGDKYGFGNYDPFKKEIKYISDTTENQIFFQILRQGDRLYFLSEGSLIDYSLKRKKVENVFKAFESVSFNKIFILDNQVIISLGPDKFFTPHKGILVPFYLEIAENEEVNYASRHPVSDTYIIITNLNNLYLFKDHETKKVTLDQHDYLKESGITEMVWLNDSLIAAASIRGGVMFINPFKNEFVEILNFNSGLPDNEVYKIFSDKEKGLWIAHQFGFTMVVPDIPFKKFSIYPGLEGIPLAIQAYDGELYIGSNNGIYILERVNEFKETVQLEKVSVTIKPKKQETLKNVIVEEVRQSIPEPENDKRKSGKGLLGLFKKNKLEESKSVEPVKERSILEAGFLSIASNPNQEEDVPQVQETFEKRIKRELSSIKYNYKKLDNTISGKCKQFIAGRRSLFAFGGLGLYEIKGKEVKSVYENAVASMALSEDNKTIYLSTLSNEIKIFREINAKWEDQNLLKGFNEDIQSLLPQGEYLWLCGKNLIYRVDLAKPDPKITKFHIPNHFTTQITAVLINNTPYFLSSGGYYYFNGQELVEDFDLEQKFSMALKVIPDNDFCWLYDGSSWKPLGDKFKNDTGYKLLNLFSDISYISHDVKGGNYYAIATDNQIFKIDAKNNERFSTGGKILLKEIKSKSGFPANHNKLIFDHHNSNLVFQFSYPDYLGLMKYKFQYFLEGLSESWSEWSHSNSVSFHYLPNGDYKLKIRSINAFDEIEEGEEVSFKVLPPYWQTSWFYALEGIFFGTLLIISFRLNRNTKNRFIGRILTYLTIIIFIEFLQAVVESLFDIESTPVFDFIIQAFVALLVFPVELILRKFILKEETSVDI